MKIAVIGATGWLGGAIAREALERGHEVTAIGRDPEKLAALQGMNAVAVDATQSDALAEAIAGHSAITSGDTAAAMVDELEQPRFGRRRFTAAYGSPQT
jgi:putative NADH-flavin reductase